MDVEDIQPGENFAQKIESTLARCAYVLVVIGPRWRPILDERAKQSDPDYVLHEIATALKQKKTVIPVFVKGATPSSLASLPPALADLPFHQAVELRDSSFNDDCDRLAKSLPLSRRWVRQPVLWAAAAIVVGLAILLATYAGIGPWHASHERKLQVAGLMKTAGAQVEQSEFESAFDTYKQAINLAPNEVSVLDGQLNAAMLWLEDFHALAPEGQKPEDIAAPLLAQIKTVLDGGLARATGKDKHAADILAHLGWEHWLNEKIAFKEFGNAERFFAQALAIDPSNVYAHTFWGSWLMQTDGDSAAAIRHFQSALATGEHRDLVRRFQLGGLLNNDAPGMRAEFVRVLNEMRINHEPLDKTVHDRVSYLYSPTVSAASELREVLAAVPPDQGWQTFLWLIPDAHTHEDQTAWRDFIHANLAEISGNRTAALAEFRTIAGLLRVSHGDGRILDYTNDAIHRLTTK